MRFFLDHCVPEAVARTLESEGYEVIRLRHRLPTGAPDTEVSLEAQALDAILVSLNGDFSDIVTYPPSSHGGVIALQVKNRPEAINHLLDRIINYTRKHDNRDYFRGKLLLVEVHRIRIRT